MERRSCVYFASYDAGTVTGEKPCVNVKKQQDTLTLNVSDYSETVRLVAHNDGGIFTLGPVHIEQDMLYAGACVAGWLLLFVLLDAFLLLTVPGSPVRLADAELCACLWVLCAVAVLTCAPAMTNSGALQGADWSFHLSRIEGIAQGLREGQFPVRVYSIAKDGYGYAPSLFYGELLLYFPAVLRLLGMSVQGAYHTYLLALQLLTAGIAFFSLRQIFRHNKTALVGSVLYMLSTYHLYKIYWLSAVGEYTAMAFLPLIPAALYELYGERPLTRKRLRRACAELVAAFGMLLQVHLLSLEMAVLATAVFCLMRFRRTFSKAVFFTWLKAAVLTVLLNLWFLVPFLTLMLSGDYNNMYTGSAEKYRQCRKWRPDCEKQWPADCRAVRLAEKPQQPWPGIVGRWVCAAVVLADPAGQGGTAAAGAAQYPPGALGRRVCGAGLLDEHEHFPVAGRGPHPGGGAYPGGNPVPGAVSFFGDGAAGTGGDVRVGGAAAGRLCAAGGGAPCGGIGFRRGAFLPRPAERGCLPG